MISKQTYSVTIIALRSRRAGLIAAAEDGQRTRGEQAGYETKVREVSEAIAELMEATE